MVADFGYKSHRLQIEPRAPIPAARVMAGFKTHITTSSVLGVAFGTAGFLKYGVPARPACWPPACAAYRACCPTSTATPACPIARAWPSARRSCPSWWPAACTRWPFPLDHHSRRRGNLPGHPLRLGVRAQEVHGAPRHVSQLSGTGIFGLLTYLLAPGASTGIRWFQSAAVVTGFMSHLVLDEIWSLGLNTGSVHVEKSFGTAMKFWGPSPWANTVGLRQAALLVFATLREPNFMQNVENGQYGTALNEVVQSVQQSGQLIPGGTRTGRGSGSLQNMTGQVVRDVLNSLNNNQAQPTGPAAAPTGPAAMPAGPDTPPTGPAAAPRAATTWRSAWPRPSTPLRRRAATACRPPPATCRCRPTRAATTCRSMRAAMPRRRPAGATARVPPARVGHAVTSASPPATATPQNYSWSPPSGNTLPASGDPSSGGASPGGAWSSSLPPPPPVPAWSIGSNGATSSTRIPPPSLNAMP